MIGAELFVVDETTGAGFAGAGVAAGGLLAATTGASALGVTAVLLLTVESLGASVVVLGAAESAGVVLEAELSALVVAAGAALAAASSLAKAAVVKTSKVRVNNRLSFGFMCLIRSGVDGHVLRMSFFIPSPLSSRGAKAQKRPYEHG